MELVEFLLAFDFTNDNVIKEDGRCSEGKRRESDVLKPEIY